MAEIKSIQAIQEKWGRVTPQRSEDYALGIKKAIKKGPSRFAEGVVVGASDYGTGFAPYADVIKATTLTPRFPRGDIRNLDRVKVMSQALRKKK